MNLLPVNEIFSTIQGEGTYTGTPAIFIRLQFCPVGCPWCDTKHTWELDKKNKVSFDEMMAKTADSPTYCDCSPDFLAQWCISHPEKLIVITGGEPATYDLYQLTRELCDAGKDVQIETSGTIDVNCDSDTFVTVSPKLNMPGGRAVLDSVLQRADEIKMPIGKQSDVDNLKILLANADVELATPVYLQPLSQSPKATELCIEQARLNGWKLSAQLHKYIGVR